jgi:FdhD protein
VVPRVGIISNNPAYLEHLLSVPIHQDVYPGLGPLAGIHAGLSHTEGEGALFLACDMALVTEPALRHMIDAAAESGEEAVVARGPGGPEPLLAVYRKALLPDIEARLQAGDDLSAISFLSAEGAEYVDFGRSEAAIFRDIDQPADLALLRAAFGEVEPLPVISWPMARIGRAPLEQDVVVLEAPFALKVNGVHLATLQCLPNALRELTVGYLAYLGLVGSAAEAGEIQVDYEGGRIEVTGAQVSEESLRDAFKLDLSSAHGAPLPQEAGPAPGGVHMTADYILDCVRRLRDMAPVFARTGATHQAAFLDAERVLHFDEDVGRHNAIDKVVGRCLVRGTDTCRGALLATGRLNVQMVVKALRMRMPIVASRSAPTSAALELAREHGMTVVGFARGRRLNVYTAPERITGE